MAQTFRNSKPVFEEVKQQCPYDPAHWIAPDVMLKHLVRCERSLLNQPTSPYYARAKDLKKCRWSALHRIPSKDLRDHELNCPDSKSFLKNRNDEKDESVVSTAPKPFVPNSVITVPIIPVCGDEENWDDDPGEGGGYDPQLKVETDASLIYNKQGMSKAQRRDFAIERRRQADEQKRGGGLSDRTFNQAQQAAPRWSSAAAQPRVNKSSDEWTTVQPSPSRAGRGRAKVQDASAFNDLAAMASAMPNVVPVGRGRGRGGPTSSAASSMGPPPGFKPLNQR